MTINIKFFSDIHLEMNAIPQALRSKNLEGGDVLIMNGDIHVAKLFLPGKNDADARSAQKKMLWMNEYVFPKFKHVIHIMGNHEHYGGVIYDSSKIFQDYYNKIGANNVTVFENEYLHIDNIVIFGATLWTDMDKGNPMAELKVMGGMNDYRIIYTERDEKFALKNPLRAHHTMDLHKETLASLNDVCDLFPDKKIIVATHHAPSFQSEYKRGGELSPGYCSDLEKFITDRPNIKYWIHGHTHNPVFYEIGQCKVETAMYGYEYYEPHIKQNFKVGNINI